MGTLKNINCECIMKDQDGNEYTAKIFISEASTEGFSSKQKDEDTYAHELILKPTGYEITINDGLDNQDPSAKLRHWSIK